MAGKVLIIDDDSRNVFALSAVLSARKYACISAPGAAAGIELLASHTDVDVILMDMMMPDMDGYEAMAVINQNTDTAGIPVIAVTAQAMVGDRQKCLDAGAAAYISKPVNVNELQLLLNQYIKQ